MLVRPEKGVKRFAERACPASRGGVMLGFLSRRPRPDPEAVARLKGWVGALLSLTEADHVAVAELACREPCCPDLETVVAVTLADRRRFVLRFPGGVAAVTEADVALLRPGVPER